MQPIPPLKPRKRRVKRKMSARDLRDQKFKDSLMAYEFRSRIEREAKQILCHECGITRWRVQDKHQQVDVTINEIIVTMTCCKCGKQLLFATKLDQTGEEEDEDAPPTKLQRLRRLRAFRILRRYYFGF